MHGVKAIYKANHEAWFIPNQSDSKLSWLHMNGAEASKRACFQFRRLDSVAFKSSELNVLLRLLLSSPMMIFFTLLLVKEFLLISFSPSLHVVRPGQIKIPKKYLTNALYFVDKRA